MIVRGRGLALAWLTACPLGQACSPLVYELAGATDTTTAPTDPSPTDPTEPHGEAGETLPPPACGDGTHNGGETDLDCGGPCGPCGPGQRCEAPQDCLVGDCLGGICPKLACSGPQDCQPAAPCMASICTPEGQCAVVPADGVACEDDDPCTFKEVCMAGKCIPFVQLDCSEFAGPCRAGVCNPQTGACAVEWLFEGQPCKDGRQCDLGAQCTAGECVARQPPGPLLFTDFSLAGGWIAEPPWALGPAKPSQCGPGLDDPKDDHSPSGEGHVAGAAIGGCLPIDGFPDVCLASPPIDATLMPGELWLDYWSVLRSAGAPMVSRVEVFDGKNQKWLPLVVTDTFTAEPDWTEHSIDLTPFKGPALRVRFCHAASGKSEPVGGWSIDDLRIGAPQCF